MAALQPEDSLIGTVIRKKVGSHWYAGRVVGITPSITGADQSCRVIYEDGEEADVPQSEVRIWASAIVFDAVQRVPQGLSNSSGMRTFPCGPTPPQIVLRNSFPSGPRFASDQRLVMSGRSATALCVLGLFTGVAVYALMLSTSRSSEEGLRQSFFTPFDFLRTMNGGTSAYEGEGIISDSEYLPHEISVSECEADIRITKDTPETDPLDTSDTYMFSVPHSEYLDMFNSPNQKMNEGRSDAPLHAGKINPEAGFTLKSESLHSLPLSVAGTQSASSVDYKVLQGGEALIFHPLLAGPSSMDANTTGDLGDELDPSGGPSLVVMICASGFMTMLVFLRSVKRHTTGENKVSSFAKACGSDFAGSAAGVAIDCPVFAPRANDSGTFTPNKSASCLIDPPLQFSLQPEKQLTCPSPWFSSLPQGSRSPSFCQAAPAPAVVAAGCCMFPVPFDGCSAAEPPQVVVGAHYVAVITSVDEPSGFLSVVRIVGVGRPGVVSVLPCRRTPKKTFRQAHVAEATELPITKLSLGPFLLFCGRAPAFVLDHMERGKPISAPPLKFHSPGHWVSSSPGQAPPTADWEAIAKQSTTVVSGARFKHCSQLRQLKAMGFQDEHAMRELLMQNGGDTRRVIEKMCTGASSEKKRSLFDIMVNRLRPSIGGA